jgi:hypothetical protein
MNTAVWDFIMWSQKQAFFESECCILRSRDKQRIEAAQMRFIRGLKALTVRDLQQSEHFGNLRLTKWLMTMWKTRRCMEVMFAANQTRLPLSVFNYRPRGKRYSGRPRKRWFQQFMYLGTGLMNQNLARKKLVNIVQNTKSINSFRGQNA